MGDGQIPAVPESAAAAVDAAVVVAEAEGEVAASCKDVTKEDDATVPWAEEETLGGAVADCNSVGDGKSHAPW